MGWLEDGSHRGQGRQAWTAVGLQPRYHQKERNERMKCTKSQVVISQLFVRRVSEWVSEQVLNGTSAQSCYTVPFTLIHTGKYRTEDRLKTDIRPTTTKHNTTIWFWFSRFFLGHSWDDSYKNGVHVALHDVIKISNFWNKIFRGCKSTRVKIPVFVLIYWSLLQQCCATERPVMWTTPRPPCFGWLVRLLTASNGLDWAVFYVNTV